MTVVTTSGTGLLVVIVAIVAWGALAFGAVYPWAYWPLAGASAALGGWTIVRTRAWRERRTVGLRLVLTAIFLVLVAQVVPLPWWLFARVSPNADRFLAQYDVGYGLRPPSWHALSVAPAETLTALALFTAFALLLLGLTSAMSRLPGDRVDRLVTSLSLVGVAVSLFGVIQRAVQGNALHPPIYGFWLPEQGAKPFGPFVNPNHFAGWILLIASIALGRCCGLAVTSWRARGGRLSSWLRWLTRPEAGRLVFGALSVLVMAVALVLTRSRSGVASLVVVLLVFAYRGVRHASGTLPKVAAVAAVSLLLAGALSWGGGDAIVSKFDRASADAPGRLNAWRDALHIARDFPVIGTGAGTFGLAMLVYQTGDRQQIYFQAHNDYLQILVEGGVVLASLTAMFIGVLGWLVWPTARRETGDDVTRWIQVGAMAGLVGIAAQSSVEFSLQMPGIAALFVIVASLAIHRPPERPGPAYAHRM